MIKIPQNESDKNLQPEPAVESLPQAVPEPEVAQEKQRGPFFQAKAYFEYRLENAKDLLEKAKNDMVEEEDKKKNERNEKKLNEVKDEITYRAKPAIKKYERILEELNNGDTKLAEKEAKRRIEQTERDMRFMERENPGKNKEQLRADSEEYKSLLDDYGSLTEVLGEIGLRPEQKIPQAQIPPALEKPSLSENVPFEPSVEKKPEEPAGISPIKSPFEPFSVNTEQIKVTEEEGDATLRARIKNFYSSEKIAEETKNKPEQVKAVKEISGEDLIGKEAIEKIEKEEREEIEKKQKAERGWEFLSSSEVMRQSPKEVVDAFRNATERDLIKERNEMAYDNLRRRKYRIIRGKEAIEEARKHLVEKEKKRIENDDRSIAKEILLARVSEKIKRKKEYMENGAFSNEKYINSIRGKLGISENVFSKLINDGWKVEDAKIRNWGLWFRGPAIEIPKINSKRILPFEKKDDLKDIEEEQKFNVERKAQIEADLKIIAGKRRIILEKYNCTKVIIEKAVEEHRLEKEKKIEAERIANEEAKKNEEVRKPNIEAVTEMSKKGTPEQMRKMKKIRKQIEADIEKKKKARKRIQDLIKKQKKGHSFKVKEVDYLNSLFEEERERAA